MELPDRVPRRFGDVLPPGRGHPAEGRRGELSGLPPEMLFEPTVMAALRTAATYARPARAAVDSAPLASQLVTVAGNPAGPVPRL